MFRLVSDEKLSSYLLTNVLHHGEVLLKVGVDAFQFNDIAGVFSLKLLRYHFTERFAALDLGIHRAQSGHSGPFKRQYFL